MNPIASNRQRAKLYAEQGEAVLTLEFDVFAGEKVSMWAHTRHDVPFAEMRAAFEAVVEHLQDFIADQAMCPFNPDFLHQEPPHGDV